VLGERTPPGCPLPNAEYLVGDTADAEQFMHLTWDQMIDPQNPFFIPPHMMRWRRRWR
jgi:hypothetical protein